MKKYLFSALALPLLFACSSDDLIEKEVASNDQFAGIEKVNATFSMDEGPVTRMDNGSWDPEEGDLWGFAWLGTVAEAPAPAPEAPEAPAQGAYVVIDGNAYQNHNLIQTDGIFKPQTSIYVGKYFLYRPYDKTTVSPQAVNFSLAEQTLAEGYASTTDAWKDLAKTAINIGDKWTDVTPDGWNDDNGTRWDRAGIKDQERYKIYAAMFSNQTGLDLTYINNNPAFGQQKNVKGATDIDYNIAAGEKAGAADIFSATVQLAGAANSFTYAPTQSPNGNNHSATFWWDKDKAEVAGFFFNAAAPITLTAPEGSPISTDPEDKGNASGWFWFNSLPVTGGDAATLNNTTVVTTIKTSYGTVAVKKGQNYDQDITLADCAWVFDDPDGTLYTDKNNYSPEWMKLVAQDNQNVELPAGHKRWGIENNTFVNQFGNHKGKYVLNVDFSKAVMDIHIPNDAQLQKYLKFYMASGKQDNIRLILDGKSETDKTFKLSKISIAMLQTINAAQNDRVLVEACTEHNAPVKIIVTQDGQEDLGLAAKKEVPALNQVFRIAHDVYLSKDCQWTWGGGADGMTALPIDGGVKSITNEGTLTVNATNVELTHVGAENAVQPTIYNAKDATMNITKVTTVKNTLNNLGTINVPATAELRAYGIKIINDATTLKEFGVINNYGVLGSTSNTNGEFHNWGLINMLDANAMTLLKSNELGQTVEENYVDPFGVAFNKETNKMGTVVLPDNNPTAIVSVSNAAETGFIKYNWTAESPYTYETPAGNVKFNTVVISSDITFDAVEAEIQYLEFKGDKTKVVNPTNLNLPNLKGIIVYNENEAGEEVESSIIIEKTNTISCSVGAFLGTKATVYKGGAFTYPEGATTNYLGVWSTDQVVEWGN